MNYRYNYIVQNIGNDEELAYKAIVPAFGGAIVYGDTLEELSEGVQGFIAAEIKELKKKGKPIPVPEVDTNASGKISLRIQPVLHQQLIIEAKSNQLSLNKYIETKLRS